MTQLHKRFTDEQVKVLLKGYCQGLLKRAEIQEMLDIGKTRFFALLKEYRKDPEGFSVAYERHTPGRLSGTVETEIERELLREKAIVEDKRLPISGYNYSALRDRLKKKGIKVSVTTIIDRAKRLNCYKPRQKRKTHDREVLTASIGALVQHDSSLHLWSPFAEEKWVLITSIDDFSRMLLFADFVPKDTTWAHIQAAQALMQSYGIPLRYYVDSLRVFRFVQGRDSVWRKHVLQTDDVDTQWGKMMRELGVDVIYALSPQAKDYASYCTSFALSGTISANRRRVANLRPWDLIGASGPGGSYRQLFLSL
jgi:transposase